MAYNDYIINLSSFIDSHVHKLEVYGISYHYGVCYFRFEDEVYTNDSKDFNNIYYEIEDGVAVVSGVYNQDIKVAVIASEYNNYPVTSIRYGAFAGCNNLISVRIPETITTISDKAFWESYNIKSMHFNAINCNIIQEENYSEIELFPSSSYDTPASLEKVVFGNKVKAIPAYLCNGCGNLTSVTIPDSVTTVGENAFYGCRGLTSLKIGTAVHTINARAFALCSGLTSIEIPNSVITIGDYAFGGCSGLQSLDIPESVTSIGNSSFLECNGLTSVYIPKTLITIGSTPFHDCKQLTKIIVDSQNQNYSSEDGILFSKDGSMMIDWPGAKRPYHIPSFVKKLGKGVFANYQDLTTIDIPNSVTEIQPLVFYRSGIDSIRIPNSVTIIGELAFEHSTISHNKMSYIYIPASVTSIGSGAFNSTYITKVEFENIESIAKINYESFVSTPLCSAEHLIIDGKEITDLIIPNTITSINNYAFYSKLWTSITIPESVNSIGDWAFGYTPDLKFVTCLATTPPILGDKVFSPQIPLLYVPKGTVEYYQNSDWAQYFASIEEIKNYLTVEIEGDGKVYANVFNEVENGEKFDGTNFTFFLLPDSGNQISSIILDDKDIMADIIDHRLSITDYVGTGELQINFAPENKATLTVSGSDTHSITHTYNEGSTAIVKLHPEAGWTLHSATYNDKDVTDLLHNNDFVTEPLYGSNTLSFVLTNDNTDSIDGASDAPDSKVHVSIKRNIVSIQGVADNEPISVYDLSGTTVYTGFARHITLSSGKAYILTTPSKTFKIAI